MQYTHAAARLLSIQLHYKSNLLPLSLHATSDYMVWVPRQVIDEIAAAVRHAVHVALIPLQNRLIRMENRIMSAEDDLAQAVHDLSDQVTINNDEIEDLLKKILNPTNSGQVAAAVASIRDIIARNKSEVDKAKAATADVASGTGTTGSTGPTGATGGLTFTG